MLRARDNMRALRASERRKRALLQALPDSIYTGGRNGSSWITSPAARRIPGTTLIGRRIESVVPVATAQAARLAMNSASGRESVTTLEFETGSDGDQRAFEARLRPQADGTFLMILRDATERRRAERQIEYLAYYDTLTGLPNRQLFVRDVTRALAAAQRANGMVALLSSISTASSASTTTSVTPWATPCCAASRAGSSAACGPRTRSRRPGPRPPTPAGSRAWEATSS